MRADKFLVDNGYFESRAKAVAAIKAGKVLVNGRALTKPSANIPEGATIQAEAAFEWVSRGGLKLVGALDSFKVDVSGRTCLDVGASTGGFTDVLLSRGVAKVYAVDVGRDQLHPKLKSDDRVISMEGTDSRHLTAEMFVPVPDVIVCDASFISAGKVLDVPLDLAASGDLITLVKPQFEVGKAHIGKGGIVKDPAQATKALQDVCAWVERKGWRVKSTMTSPITGGDGNQEFLLWAQK